MSKSKQQPQQGGAARSAGISYQELLVEEVNPVPDVLRIDDCAEMGSEPLPVERYTSQAFHDLEVEKVWKRVWQMACREEQIPNVGDHVLYEIANYSFIVARTAKEEIKAFYNTCLHRGRRLRDEAGCVNQFRCPFHGFTWTLDGSLKTIPCEWDFPHIDRSTFSLPEAHVDTWGGFVFINMSENPPALSEYLGVLPEHFERWPLENTWTSIHVEKIVPANWKATMEAFLESWHSMMTHPQILPYTADSNSQYDTFGEHINRTITAMGSPSPHLKNVPQQKILDSLVNTSGRMSQESDVIDQVPDGMTARRYMADTNRSQFGEMFGMDLSDASDTEVLDAILYQVFPNFVPWAGYNPNIVYRFRPNGNDPHSCIMEVMIMMRVAAGAAKPAPVAVRKLGVDEPFSAVEELGALGDVFDQDMGNLPYVQLGMAGSKNGKVTLGNYQEARIRHFHLTLGKYLAQ